MLIDSVLHKYICLNLKKIVICTLIKENLSGKELPIVNKALDGSRWTFQPSISLDKQDSLVKHHYAKWIYVKLFEAVLKSVYVI